MHNSKEDFRLQHNSRRHLKRKNNTTVILFAEVISLAKYLFQAVLKHVYVARKSVFSLVSSKQKVENDIRTQRCVLVMGGGGGRENGGDGGGGSVARGNACSDE